MSLYGVDSEVSAAKLVAAYQEVADKGARRALLDRLARLREQEEERRQRERLQSRGDDLESYRVNEPLLRTIILREVCEKHGVPPEQVLGPRRQMKLLNARQELYWRLHNETVMSLPQIGGFVGGRDHSTIHHGIRKFQAQQKEQS